MKKTLSTFLFVSFGFVLSAHSMGFSDLKIDCADYDDVAIRFEARLHISPDNRIMNMFIENLSLRGEPVKAPFAYLDSRDFNNSSFELTSEPSVQVSLEKHHKMKNTLVGTGKMGTGSTYTLYCTY